MVTHVTRQRRLVWAGRPVLYLQERLVIEKHVRVRRKLSNVMRRPGCVFPLHDLSCKESGRQSARPNVHDDVIKWKHFSRYWPFVRGIHRWIPITKTSSAELWCFLWSNKRLSKQSWGWWFETPSRISWHNCNVFTSTRVTVQYV